MSRTAGLFGTVTVTAMRCLIACGLMARATLSLNEYFKTGEGT